jgi:hypothetical protein
MILYGRLLCCLDSVITIAAAFTVNEIFTLPTSNTREAFEDINVVKRKYANEQSDHHMITAIYNEWSTLKPANQIEFCKQNFISQGKMLAIQNMRRLLIKNFTSVGFFDENDSHMVMELNENSDKWEVVVACLTAGLFPNVVQISKDITPHMSSVVFGNANDLVVYCDKNNFHPKYFLRNVSVTNANTIALFIHNSVDNGCLTNFPNIVFGPRAAKLLVKLEKNLRFMLEKIVNDPVKFVTTENDTKILQTILNFLHNPFEPLSYDSIKPAIFGQLEQPLDENQDSDSWDSNNPVYNRPPFQDLSHYRNNEQI